MRIQRKLRYFLLLLCTILLLELFHLAHLENKRVRSTITDLVRDKRDFIERILRMEREDLEIFTLKVARLPEVEECLRSSPPMGNRPMSLPIAAVMARGKFDMLWVVSADYAIAGMRPIDSESILPADALLPGALRFILNRNYFRHGYISSGKVLIELQAAPVWEMGRQGQAALPRGYVITARSWKPEYLQHLMRLTQTLIAISFPNIEKEKPDFASGERVFLQTLTQWNGDRAATLYARFTFPAAAGLLRTNRRVLILFGAFALFIVSLLGAFFFYWIVKPLRILTRSLDQQDSRLIDKMLKQKNEFGNLSQLIFRFFRQKEELLSEIRDRKWAEQNLKVKEEKYRNLIENQGEGMVVLDAHEYFIFSNPAAEKMFGIFPERLIGYNLEDFVSEEQFHLIREQTQSRSQGKKTSYEMEITRADGEKRWIFVNATPQFEGDVSLHSFEIFVDITDRKNAEAALMESESKFRRLTEAIPSGIFILQKEKFRYVNSYLEFLTGYKREEFFSMRYQDFLHPDYRQTVGDLSRQLWNGTIEGKTPVRLEMKILTRDRRERWVDFTIDIIDFFKEKAVLGCIYDITDRKRMEEEIIKTQKMESVAQLAGGIAHDFNNYLTAILGNISLARVSAAKKPELVSILSKAENATFRARDLAQQLLTFSRGGDPVKEVMNLGPLIEETVDFVLSGSHVKAEIAIAKDLWPVEIDESQISQVFHNLIINAVEAMPDGGVIEIRAENTPSDGPPLAPDSTPGVKKESANGRSGRFVKIVLKDQGRGIEQKDLTKIFDPYFTTKKGGIGLGLAVVYSIISKHGGTIQVQSQIGLGTAFHIWMPACETQRAIKTRIKKNIFRGRGRILLMDDEDFIREVGSELLRFLGYEAEVTQDGEETIQRYRSAMESGHPFSAVIMDLTIPGKMGGMETIRLLREIDPDVRAIVSSGYSNDPVMADFKRYGFRGIVVKPYKIETLSEVLRQVIRRPEKK